MSTSNPYGPPSSSGSRGRPPGQPPPAARPLPGSPLDFGQALGFFFQDPNWVTKILVGSLFTILSIFLVGGIFIAGYAVRLLRRSARGETYPLPEWDDLGGMFTEGLAVVGAYLVHLIPAIVLMAALFAPVALLGEGRGDSSPLLAVIAISIAIVSSVGFLAILLYFPAALTRFAVEERFSSAFEVGANWAFIRRNFSNYFLAIVVFVVANFISQFGIVLFCIGLIPATFWCQCVGAYAFGEVARRDAGPSVSAAQIGA